MVGLDESVEAGLRTGGPPDTYVDAGDSIGIQALSAAGLSPAEGHTIFAYVAIAVYDAVMAVKGSYEPFAIDVDAPDGASPEAAVAAAARRILVHYLPTQTASIVDAAYQSSMRIGSDNGQTVRRGGRSTAHRR